MKQIINYLIQLFLKWKWFVLKGKIKKKINNKEVIKEVIGFFNNPNQKIYSALNLRKIYFDPPIGSLWEYLTYLHETEILIVNKKQFSTREFTPWNAIRLDHWLTQPPDSKWINLTLNDLIKIMGEKIIFIIDHQDTIPDGYFHRNLSKSVECFLLIALILGEINYGESN